MKALIAFLIFILATPAFAATDIVNDGTLGTSLVSCYDLEEASGTRDDAEGSNNLTDTNTVTSAVGKNGNAADFEADNSEYLTITDASQTGFEPSGSWTVSAWINPETLPSSNTLRLIFGKSSFNNSSSWALSLFNNAGTQSIDLDGRMSSTQPAELLVAYPSLSTGTWYHIVGKFVTASHLQLWVNGTAIGSLATVRTNPANNTMAVRLGASNAPGAYFDGLIDTAAFWSTALSTSSIQALYNSGSGVPCVSSVTPTYGQPAIMFE